MPYRVSGDVESNPAGQAGPIGLSHPSDARETGRCHCAVHVSPTTTTDSRERMVSTTLTVNGSEVRVSAPPDTPLLFVLRNELGLKGTLFGCGTGSCGACFVLIDDRAVASCDTPLSAVRHSSVRTVEGLAQDGLSSIQRAFIAEQAGQCSYCVPGILISATALSRKGEVSATDLLEAMDRHLCRCGGHNRFVRAIRNTLDSEHVD